MKWNIIKQMSLVLQFNFNCTLFKSWQSKLDQNPQNKQLPNGIGILKKQKIYQYDWTLVSERFSTRWLTVHSTARRGGPPTCLQTLLEVFKLGYIDSTELLLVYVCSSCLTGATLYDPSTHSCPINTCQSSTYPLRPTAICTTAYYRRTESISVLEGSLEVSKIFWSNWASKH